MAVQIVRAYPGARTTIVVPHIQEARQVAGHLRAAGIKASVITSKDSPSEEARVTVVTFGQLGRIWAGLHSLDLLIVLDGVAALGKVARYFLTPGFTPDHKMVPRIVGFLPADRHLAPADKVELVELFGPEMITVPAHGWVERQVQVVPLWFAGGKGSYAPLASTRKRRNLSHHRLRNRLVARVARLLTARDLAALLADVPGLANVAEFQVPAHVVVVVENQEHALALKAKLPDWPIDAPAAGWMVTEIRTYDGLRTRPLQDVDVVVRADGGTGLFPLAPLALASQSSQPARPLVVIDILDRNHPELRQAVKSRVSAYMEAGWRPAGCDAVDFALLTLFPERGHQ